MTTEERLATYEKAWKIYNENRQYAQEWIDRRPEEVRDAKSMTRQDWEAKWRPLFDKMMQYQIAAGLIEPVLKKRAKQISKEAASC